jgi:hypothetical protein
MKWLAPLTIITPGPSYELGFWLPLVDAFRTFLLACSAELRDSDFNLASVVPQVGGTDNALDANRVRAFDRRRRGRD